MPVTGEQVFNLACALIDEISENGSVVLDNPDYYKTKSASFLTILQTELLPLNQTPVIITDITQDLILDDRTAIKVLPYGLAAHLLLTDDPNTSAFFNARYDELKRIRPTAIQPITDKYNLAGDNDG
jgi:hypothetical protein